ncbi:lipocalin-like domain-containing protein [uncultured Cohaesibacter sp.]|uniref:lipocalin-like domain-containing protein n=1 Tax=uncultured Cohaesibacter sp. TaxID=1002546 RepID=UPI0029C8E5C7|nr:lipocalin-like domain-containing protein [uncultured Cohaesibacter sp.]
MYSSFKKLFSIGLITLSAAIRSEASLATEIPRPSTVVNSLAYDDMVLTIRGNESLVDVSRDLNFHGGIHTNESWFTTSNLTSGTGDSIGLQTHFIAKRLPSGDTVLLVNFGLVNERTKAYRGYDQIYNMNDATISQDAFMVKSPEGSMSGDINSIQIKASFDDVDIDLDLKNVRPPLINEAQGKIGFFDDLEQYEYAFTAMQTTGRIVMGPDKYDVSGISWFDRQYGAATPLTAYSRDQWAWFNPQLDNGASLSISQMYEFEKKEVRMQVTAALANGSQVVAVIDPIQMSDYWVSPDTGKRFPTQFDVSIPELSAKLHFDVPYKAQEILTGELARKMVKSLSKYEGKMIVSGTMFGKTVKGEGYVELVGRWK